MAQYAHVKYGAVGSIRSAPRKFLEWRKAFDKSESQPDARASSKRAGPGLAHLFVFDSRTGGKHPIGFQLHLTVGELKDAIYAAELTELPLDQIRLSWGSQVLSDARTLTSYRIDGGQCLHVTRGCLPQLDPSRAHRNCAFSLAVCCLDDSPRPMLAQLQVRVRSMDCILAVKQQLEAQTGIAPADQRLMMAGRSLCNDMTLQQCGVRDGSAVLQLVCPFGVSEVAPTALERNRRFCNRHCSIETPEFPLLVKELWPGGRSFYVNMSLDNTVRMIKRQITSKSGVEPERQMLLHRGRVLLDDLTANYYNLEGGTRIDLALVGGRAPLSCAAPAEWRSKPRSREKLPPITPRLSCKLAQRSADVLGAQSTLEPSTHQEVSIFSDERVSSQLVSVQQGDVEDSVSQAERSQKTTRSVDATSDNSDAFSDVAVDPVPNCKRRNSNRARPMTVLTSGADVAEAKSASRTAEGCLESPGTHVGLEAQSIVALVFKVVVRKVVEATGETVPGAAAASTGRVVEVVAADEAHFGICRRDTPEAPLSEPLELACKGIPDAGDVPAIPSTDGDAASLEICHKTVDVVSSAGPDSSEEAAKAGLESSEQSLAAQGLSNSVAYLEEGHDSVPAAEASCDDVPVIPATDGDAASLEICHETVDVVSSAGPDFPEDAATASLESSEQSLAAQGLSNSVAYLEEGHDSVPAAEASCGDAVAEDDRFEVMEDNEQTLADVPEELVEISQPNEAVLKSHIEETIPDGEVEVASGFE